MRRLSVLMGAGSVAVVIAVAVVTASVGAESEPVVAPEAEVAKVDPELNGAVVKTFSNSAGGGVSIGITREGNVLSWSTLGAADVMFTEGYFLCNVQPSRFDYFDLGNAAGGFGSAVFTNISPTKAKVVRTTSDGRFKLTQEFTFDPADHELAIKSTLVNLSGTTTSLFLRRYGDVDLRQDGSALDFWMSTSLSVSAWDAGYQGVMLKRLAGAELVLAYSHAIGINTCSPGGTATPVVAPGADRGMSLILGWPNVPPGGSVTGTVAYIGI